MFPKAWCGLRMRYDLRILATQCYHCNINLGGNGATFSARFILDNSLQLFMDLFTDVMYSKQEKWTPEKRIQFLENLLEDYKLLRK